MTTLKLTHEQALTLRCALSSRQVQLGEVWRNALALHDGNGNVWDNHTVNLYVYGAGVGAISLRHLYEQRCEVDEMYVELTWRDGHTITYRRDAFEFWATV